jgi:RNA polymerase sigma-70 factor (ECF subfamily)
VIDRAASTQLPDVRAVAAGTKLATQEFSAVYRAEFAFVVNSLRRLGIHQDDLEDLTHEVFMTALRRRDSYDPERPIRAWLFGIAFRVAADFKRLVRHSRELPLAPGAEARDGGLSPDEAAVSSQDRQLVLDALARVELSRRGVFIMHDIEGFAAPEIAQALDIPLGTAASRLRQARIEFAAAVRALRPAGGER